MHDFYAITKHSAEKFALQSAWKGKYICSIISNCLKAQQEGCYAQFRLTIGVHEDVKKIPFFTCSLVKGRVKIFSK